MQSRPVAQRQQMRSDMYLPPMPDMLQAPRQQLAGPPRYGQRELADTKPAPKSNVVIRGQSADEPPPKPKPTAAMPAPAPSKLAIPSPEELGLAAASSAPAGDWPMARARLDKLGATYYRLEKAPEGFRFICALPYPQAPSKQREFEALGASEPEAIRQALAQVEQWQAAR